MVNCAMEVRSHFEVKHVFLLCCEAPIDRYTLLVIPESFKARFTYLSHYLLLQGHPSSTAMYETIRRDYYGSNMTSYIHQTVKDCRA